MLPRRRMGCGVWGSSRPRISPRPPVGRSRHRAPSRSRAISPTRRLPYLQRGGLSRLAPNDRRGTASTYLSSTADCTMQRAASQAAGPLLPGPCPFPGVPPWCPAPGDPPGPDPGTPCVQLGPWQVSLAPAGPLGEASSTAAVNASTNLIADLPSGVPVSGTPSSCRTTATARALATYQTAGASPRWARRSAEETVRGTPPGEARQRREGAAPL